MLAFTLLRHDMQVKVCYEAQTQAEVFVTACFLGNTAKSSTEASLSAAIHKETNITMLYLSVQLVTCQLPIDCSELAFSLDVGCSLLKQALVYGTCRRWLPANSSISTSFWCQVPGILFSILHLHTQCEACLCIAGSVCRSVAQCSVVRPLLAVCSAAAAATDAHVHNRHRSCCQVQSLWAFWQ